MIIWRLNKLKKWVNDEIKDEIKNIPWDKWQWKYNRTNSMGGTKAFLREKTVVIQAFLKKNPKNQKKKNPKNTKTQAN